VWCGTWGVAVIHVDVCESISYTGHGVSFTVLSSCLLPRPERRESRASKPILLWFANTSVVHNSRHPASSHKLPNLTSTPSLPNNPESATAVAPSWDCRPQSAVHEPFSTLKFRSAMLPSDDGEASRWHRVPHRHWQRYRKHQYRGMSLQDETADVSHLHKSCCHSPRSPKIRIPMPWYSPSEAVSFCGPRSTTAMAE